MALTQCYGWNSLNVMKLVIGNHCKRKPVILGEVSRGFKLRIFLIKRADHHQHFEPLR